LLIATLSSATLIACAKQAGLTVSYSVWVWIILAVVLLAIAAFVVTRRRSRLYGNVLGPGGFRAKVGNWRSLRKSIGKDPTPD